MSRLRQARRASARERTKKALARVVKLNKVYAQLDGISQRYVVVYGGRRSSKSFSVSQLLVKKASENPGRKIIVMRKVAVTMRLSVWPRVIDALDEAGLLGDCDINKTDRTLALPNGSVFEFVGADDPQKLKSLEGATDYWLEEASEFDEIDLDTIDAGLSADVWPACQIFLTFNPVPVLEHFMPWIATRFVMAVKHEMGVLATQGEIAILRTWYKHNAFCPQKTRELLEGYSKTNPQLYRLWALGEYTQLEGAVFRNWDVVIHAPSDAMDLGVGLDFGFANDPAAAVRVWAKNDELWIKGLVYMTDLSNTMLCQEMRKAGVAIDDMITPDSAEPKSVEDLRQFGFRCVRPVKKHSGYKEELVNRVKGFKIHLVAGDVDLQREFSTYCWSKDKNGKIMPKLQDGNDHYVDAFIMRMHDYYQARPHKVGAVSAADLGL